MDDAGNVLGDGITKKYNKRFIQSFPDRLDILQFINQKNEGKVNKKINEKGEKGIVIKFDTKMNVSD